MTKFDKLLKTVNWKEEKTSNEILDFAIKEANIDSFYVGYSGGKDSGIVLDLIANQYPKYFKGVIFVNTGIATNATVNFVKDFCKEKNYPLHILTPNDVKAKGKGNLKAGQPFNYENLIKTFGFPKKSFHNNTMAWLKYYPMRDFIVKRIKKGEKPALISGVRKNESNRRKNISKYTQVPLDKSDQIIFVKPIFYKSNSWVSEYWIKTGLKKSPVYETLHLSGDCLCGCFADSKELKLIEMFHPEVFEEIKRLEQIAKLHNKNHNWGNSKTSTTEITQQTTLDDIEHLVCNDCYLDRTATDEDTERFEKELNIIESKLEVI